MFMARKKAERAAALRSKVIIKSLIDVTGEMKCEHDKDIVGKAIMQASFEALSIQPFNIEEMEKHYRFEKEVKQENRPAKR